MFSKIARENSRRPTLNANRKSETWVFDASREVPTANENRPLNMAVVVIIKVKNVNTPIAGQIDKTILATETKAGITKLKNAITAKQADAAVTEKAVAEVIEANKSIGVDQTWQDVKSQRKNGVVYTNTTGRPIMILVSEQQSSSSQTCELEINGVKVIKNVSYGTADGCIISALIPAGATYKVIYKNYPPLEWQELR